MARHPEELFRPSFLLCLDMVLLSVIVGEANKAVLTVLVDNLKTPGDFSDILHAYHDKDLSDEHEYRDMCRIILEFGDRASQFKRFLFSMCCRRRRVEGVDRVQVAAFAL